MQSSAPCGFVNLELYNVVDTEGKDKRFKILNSTHPDRRVYHFETEKAKDQEVWIEKLTSVMSSKVKKQECHSVGMFANRIFFV
jgi:hypothetical protein